MTRLSIQDKAKIIYKAKTVLRFGPALLFLFLFALVFKSELIIEKDFFGSILLFTFAMYAYSFFNIKIYVFDKHLIYKRFFSFKLKYGNFNKIIEVPGRWGNSIFLVRYKKIYFIIPAFENQDKVMEAIQNNSDCVYKCLY